jgi:hypothetical protein
LLDGGVTNGLLLAVLGSRVLFEYEQTLLRRGYQRRWGVFMDAPSIARAEADLQARKAAIAEWQKKAAAGERPPAVRRAATAGTVGRIATTGSPAEEHGQEGALIRDDWMRSSFAGHITWGPR